MSNYNLGIKKKLVTGTGELIHHCTWSNKEVNTPEGFAARRRCNDKNAVCLLCLQDYKEKLNYRTKLWEDLQIMQG